MGEVKDTVLDGLARIREPIAEYQDSKGVPKDEEYGFISLLGALWHHTYNAAEIIATMLYNLLPIFDGFLYFVRFLLDKLISILETTDTTDRIIKIAIFVGQLIVILIILYLILTILVIPILHLAHFIVFRTLGVITRK